MVNFGKEIIRQAVFPTAAQQERMDFSAVLDRLSELENHNHEYEIFRVIESGTDGTVQIADGASIRLDQYPGAADCLITGGTNGRPTDTPVYTGTGNLITGTLDSAGNYTLSGEPVSYPVYIVFQVECKAKDAGKITLRERV